MLASITLARPAEAGDHAPAGRPDDPQPRLTRMGGAGLIATPTARFPGQAGILAGGGTGTDGSRTMFVGAYPLPWLETILRRIDGPSGAPARLEDQAVDLRLRLLAESRWVPATAIGLTDAIDGGTGSEFLVFSKRHYGFDLSGGLGWGRLGESELLANPFSGVAGVYDGARAPDDSGPFRWFTGTGIGVFGGIAYHFARPDLTLKLEYDSSRRGAERQRDLAQDRGLPVSAAVSYRPWPWLDLGAGIARLDTGFLSLSLHYGLAPTPTDRHGGAPPSAKPAPPTPHSNVEPRLRSSSTGTSTGPRPSRPPTETRLSVNLAGRGTGRGEPVLPPAPAIGAAAVQAIDPVGPAPPDVVTVIAHVDGFAPTRIALVGRNLAAALAHRGSPEELWQDALIEPLDRMPEDGLLSTGADPGWRMLIAPRLQHSLTEPESPTVLRTMTDVSLTTRIADGLVAGGSVRLDLADTLHRLDRDGAVSAAEAVRSDVAAFADGFPLSLDTAHLQWAGRMGRDWHALLAGGLLEEMYAGVGAELLYRPFRGRWNLGADLHRVWKRQPGALPAWHRSSGRMTGHVSAGYASADANRSAVLSVGRYLGRDWGASLDILNRFANGWLLGAAITVSEGLAGRPNRNADTEQHLSYGLRLRIPLAEATPDGLPLRIAPEGESGTIGRDAGQRLDRPATLRSLTDPTSFGRIAGSWPALLDGERE